MNARDELLRFAEDEGFPFARIAPADAMTDELARAQEERSEGHLDGMGWITNEWLERSTSPRTFLDGARSVLLVALRYGQGRPPTIDDSVTRGRVAGYAQGRDYHRVFEKKLRRIARRVREDLGAEARATVDYGPLLERPLAARSGLGWIGKSTMLLVPGAGPWVLLGAVATTLDIEPDAPLKKSCGSCTRCVAACPTGAISPDGRVDARLCISYHTIENRGVVPRELRGKFGNWVFGCDECLTSCPVGGAVQPEPHPDLAARTIDDAAPPLTALLSLTGEQFKERFQGRAIMRAKRDGLVRNACIALGNTGSAADLPSLTAALDDEIPLVRGHAAWAVGRLGGRLGLAVEAMAPITSRRKREPDGWVTGELDAALAVLKEDGR